MKSLGRLFGLTVLFTVVFFAANAWAGIDYGPWLTGVTQDTITVKWGSPQAGGLVEYGPTNSLGLEADTVYADGVHRADLDSLEPGTRYYYRVSSGGDTSAIQSFLTAPEPTEPFHFGVISDTQVNPDVYLSVAEALLVTEPAFVLHNGDLTELPFVPSEWTDFWSVTDLVAGQAPYFPVKGNHDLLPGGSEHFALYWTNPMNEDTPSPSVYSFQYGNTFFINLDIGEAYDVAAEQYLWLEEQLDLAKADPTVKHCIVHAHFPPFSCSKHGNDDDVLTFREAVVPLFEEYEIDLYLSGHDHTYQRSVVNGITYLVTGCASGRITGYNCDPQEWTVTCEKTQNFSAIEIDGNEITVKARRPDSSLIESFTINHDFHSGDDDDDTTPDDDDDDNDDATDDDDDTAGDDDDDDDSGCGC